MKGHLDIVVGGQFGDEAKDQDRVLWSPVMATACLPGLVLEETGRRLDGDRY